MMGSVWGLCGWTRAGGPLCTTSVIISDVRGQGSHWNLNETKINKVRILKMRRNTQSINLYSEGQRAARRH